MSGFCLLVKGDEISVTRLLWSAILRRVFFVVFIVVVGIFYIFEFFCLFVFYLDFFCSTQLWYCCPFPPLFQALHCFCKLTLLCENQWRHSANSQLLNFTWLFQNGMQVPGFTGCRFDSGGKEGLQEASTLNPSPFPPLLFWVMHLYIIYRTSSQNLVPGTEAVVLLQR